MCTYNHFTSVRYTQTLANVHSRAKCIPIFLAGSHTKFSTNQSASQFDGLCDTASSSGSQILRVVSVTRRSSFLFWLTSQTTENVNGHNDNGRQPDCVIAWAHNVVVCHFAEPIRLFDALSVILTFCTHSSSGKKAAFDTHTHLRQPLLNLVVVAGMPPAATSSSSGSSFSAYNCCCCW